MKNLHIGLDFPKTVFNEFTNIHSFQLTRRTLLTPMLHLNLDVLKIIKDSGLRIGLAELFYSPPNMFSGIHRDNPADDISKINWVYHGTNSKMCWYETDPDKPILGQGSSTYRAYSLEESKLICKTEIHSPSLIQAAIAHNVHNDTEPRWSVSLMLYNGAVQCPYNETIERLKNYII